MTSEPDERQPSRQPKARPASMRSEYKALTRQRLTQAAAVAFEEKGYAACTIEELARSAGTSRATFYTHFSGKVELIDGLWDVTRRTLIKLYRDLANMHVRDLASLEAWLDASFRYYEDNRLKLLAIQEAITLERELAIAYQERTGEVVSLISPLIRRMDDETEGSRHLRAALLTMQHDRFCFFSILRQMPFDRDESLKTLAHVWFEAIGT